MSNVVNNNVSFSDWVSYFTSYKLPSLASYVHEKYDLKTNEAIENKLTYFVFDFSTLKNIYLGDNFEKITGYPKEEGMNGFSFIQKHIHPDDTMKNMRFSKVSHEILMKVPFDKRKDAKLRMNYRFMHPEKGVISILHQATFSEFSDEGIPLLSYGFMFDITGFIPSNYQIGILEFCDGESVLLDANEHIIHFTKREKEIICLAKNGIASKNIADELGVSINTVHNIRARLLQKTGAKNMTELIAMASDKGLI